MDLQLWAERLAVEEWAGLGGQDRGQGAGKIGQGWGAVKQGAGSREESTEEQRKVQGIGSGAGGRAAERRAQGDGEGGRKGAGSRAGRPYLSGPQVQLLERRQFDEVLSAGTGYIGEGQAEVLQVSEGAGAQQAGQVGVLQTDGQVGLGGGLGLPGVPETLSLHSPHLLLFTPRDL